MTVPRGTSFLAGIVLVGTLAALAIPEPRAEGMIASTSEAEVCASDGLPGSAYSRTHRVVKRRGVPGHQIDHILPLALGGADNDANIQIQPIEEALEKDRLEKYAAIMVCRYQRVPLAEAQEWFTSGNWREQMWRIER